MKQEYDTRNESGSPRKSSVLLSVAEESLGAALANCGTTSSAQDFGHEMWWWFLEDLLRSWALVRSAKQGIGDDLAAFDFLSTAEAELAQALSLCGDKPSGTTGIARRKWPLFLEHIVRAWGAVHYAQKEFSEHANRNRRPTTEELRRALLEVRRHMEAAGFTKEAFEFVAAAK